MLQLEPAAFDVKECLADTLAVFTGLARMKHINLSSSVAPSVPLVIMQDKSRVRQVLFNLIGTIPEEYLFS